MELIKSQMEMLSENAQGVVNYNSWRFKLDLILKSKDLFMVATGLLSKPTELKTAKDEKVTSWTKKDLESQALIGLNVSSKIATKILNCKSACQMLKKLDSLYGKKSELTVEGLQRRFFSYSYDTNKSAVENCLEIQQLAEDLAAEGEEVKEGWIMTRILGILPPKLYHFRTAWDNVSGTEKNIKKERDSYKHMVEAAQKTISEQKSSGSNHIPKTSYENEDVKDQVAMSEQQISCLEDELSESRVEASRLRTELVSERSGWEVQLSELNSRLNDMEEEKILSSGRVKISGLKTKMELAWQKEREEQHRLLQETSTLARDLRQTLFEVEREREMLKQSLMSKKMLDQDDERKIINVAQLVEELTVLAPDLFPSKPKQPSGMPTPPVRRKGPKSREASPALERKDYSRESSVGRDDTKSQEVQEILSRLTEVIYQLKRHKKLLNEREQNCMEYFFDGGDKLMAYTVSDYGGELATEVISECEDRLYDDASIGTDTKNSIGKGGETSKKRKTHVSGTTIPNSRSGSKRKLRYRSLRRGKHRERMRIETSERRRKPTSTCSRYASSRVKKKRDEKRK